MVQCHDAEGYPAAQGAHAEEDPQRVRPTAFDPGFPERSGGGIRLARRPATNPASSAISRPAPTEMGSTHGDGGGVRRRRDQLVVGHALQGPIRQRHTRQVGRKAGQHAERGELHSNQTAHLARCGPHCPQERHRADALPDGEGHRARHDE